MVQNTAVKPLRGMQLIDKTMRIVSGFGKGIEGMVMDYDSLTNQYNIDYEDTDIWLYRAEFEIINEPSPIVAFLRSVDWKRKVA